MRFLLSLLLSCSVVLSALGQIMPGVVGSSQRFVQAAPDPGPPAPDFWINGSDVSKYSNSVEQGYSAIGQKGRLIDQVTTSDSHAYTSTPVNSGVLQYKPSYNGEAHFLNNQTGYTLGSVSSFNALHNGTAFTAYFTFKQLPTADATTQWNLLKTVPTTTTNSSRGIYIAYRNSTSASVLKTVRVAIMSGTGGATGPFDVNCTNNSIIDNEYNTIKIVFTGTALRVYIKNSANLTFTLIGSDLTGSGLSASDAGAVMTVGGAANAWTGYLKQVVIYNRNLSVDDETDAESWLATETLNQVTLTPANTYFAWGQSNTAGNEPQANLPADVTGNLGGHIFYAPGYSDGGHQGYWDQYYVGATTDPSNASKSSAYQRFIKEMSAAGADPYLIIRGIGSTILIPNGTGSWSSLSPVNTNDLYPIYTDQFATDALAELLHVYRKTPVIRGVIKMQGESDAANNVANTFSKYHFEYEQWCLNFTAYLNAKGYSTNLMRFANPRVYGVAAAGWIATQAAETGIMDSLLIRNPSQSGNIRASKWIDTNGLPYAAPHYLAVGYDSIGWRLARYYRLYHNEAPTFNIQDVTITVNPAQYTDQNISITANPNGAQVTSWKWRIIRRLANIDPTVMDTTMVATSTSQNPTITAITTEGLYDIQLIARNASDKYVTYQSRVFRVFAPRFTEAQADVVVNMSSGSQFLDYRGIDMSDKKIYIKGQTTNGYLEFVDLHGTSGHPVRIQKSNDNTQVTIQYSGGTGKPLFFSQYGTGQGARYIVLNGFNLDGTQGIKVTNGAVSNITVRFEGKITDIGVYGIEIASNPITIDGAAIAMVPTVASDCSKSTWAFNNAHVWYCKGVAGEEFVYVNESNQSTGYVGNNGFNPPSGYGHVISRNTVLGAGRDAIQLGSGGGEIEDNYVSNFGQQHDAGGQESCIVINSGGFGAVRRNYCITGEMFANIASGEYAFSPTTSDGRGAGQTTPKPLVFEGNIFRSGAYGTGGTDETHAIYIQNNPVSGAGDWTITFKNNLFDTDNKAAEMLLALGGYTSKDFSFVNNIVIKSGTAGDTQEFNVTGNGKATLQSGTKTINNKVLNQGDDLSGYYFNNVSTGDYSITSLLSLAYGGTPTTLSATFDYIGFPIPVPLLGYFFGPYSNYNKRITAP